MSELITSSNKRAFVPVRTTEKQLKILSPTNGYLFFTTDSKKIYLGMGDKFLSMGGNSGIYYGRKEIPEDPTGAEPSPNVTFIFPDDIEGENIPLVDDLILNTDGCFYRVKNVLDKTIETLRLTLQGTGTGGGGSGGGSVTSFTVSTGGGAGGSNKFFSVNSKVANLGFICYSNDATNYVTRVSAYMENTPNDVFYMRENIMWGIEEVHYVDIVNYLSKFNEYGRNVILEIEDKYGTVRKLTYNVKVINLKISSTQPELFQVSEDKFAFTCNVSGGTTLNANDSRIVNYELYAEDNLDYIVAKETQVMSGAEADVTKNINVSTLSHGAYLLKVYVSALISSSGETLMSNVLTYKVLRYSAEVGQPLFSILVPEVTEQYTEIPITFLLADAEDSSKYIMDLYLDGNLETQLSITANSLLVYNLLFEFQGNYSFEARIPDLGLSSSELLSITSYSGVLPVIKTDDDALVLYLTPQKKTNDATDKDIWKNYRDNGYDAHLQDFYFGNVNGWTTDEEGSKCLKLTQGAKLVNNFSPFTRDAMNLSPETGLTIELDFMLSGVLDYEENLIEYVTRDRNGNIAGGFTITGDEAKFYTKNLSGDNAIKFSIVEDQRLRFTYVIESRKAQTYPLIYAYLNGIISSATKFTNDDKLVDDVNPATLRIDSTYGQIYLYSLRVYETALGDITILNNYQASLPLVERETEYKDNLVLDNNNRVNLAAILDDPNYKLEIPLVKITGGYPCDKKFLMREKSSELKYALPVGKKDYRLIDFEIIYPTVENNEFFAGFSNFEEKCVFEEDETLTVMNGYSKTPISGAMMYAQGTSSLEYPVKNLRVKFKSKELSVRPDLGIEPVNLVCFKADFMESSGSHNTGAANFIDQLYAGTDRLSGNGKIKTPAQEHFTDKSIVTCIKGHPCLIFYCPGVDDAGNPIDLTKNENYTYIGKYNLNLDKATPEPFGFRHEDNYGLDEEGNSLIHCFEFLDNSVPVCNFLPKPDPDNPGKYLSYYDTWHNKFFDYDDDGVTVLGSHYGWTEGFESRYPEYEDEEINANTIDHYYAMCAWVNDLHCLKHGIYQYEGQANPELANKRFVEECKCHFNLDFLVSYYIITMILLMTDSRVKNCMIATWGKEEVEYKEYSSIDNYETKTSNNYIWHPIFYDMDTMLGLDNTGHVLYNFYDMDNDPTIFNGNDVLWNFVRDNLGEEIVKMYNNMEWGLAPSKVLEYFNKNQANMANEAFTNGDAKYKYIDTFRNGYIDYLTKPEGVPIGAGVGPRLYAAQGNRSLMREYFLTNRLNFLRGRYKTNNFKTSDNIKFRRYSSESTDPLEMASYAAVPPTNTYELYGLKPGYAGVISGGNGTLVSGYVEADMTEPLLITTDGETGNTETYLVGIGNLSDFGDLSNKYLGVFDTQLLGDNRIKRLILGNSHKDYYNKRWVQQTSDIDFNGFKYLEELNMINCHGYSKALDLSKCLQIKKINAIGSQANSLTLPVGGILNELRIPSTVKTLNINSHEELTANNFTIGSYDYADDNEIIENSTGHYINDYSQLVDVSIINTPIDSYSIACNAELLQSFCFQGVDWKITEYNEIYVKTSDTIRQENKDYYVYNRETGGYNAFDGVITGNAFAVFELSKLYDENNEITAIPVLDFLNTKAYFENSVNSKKDALTGTLTIDVPGAKASEFNLYQKYHSMFPNLEIKYGENTDLKEAFTINFYNQENYTDSSQPYYTVLGEEGVDLGTLTSASGPNGIALRAPSKDAVNNTVYEFSGFWRNHNDGKLYEQAKFNEILPKDNMNFTPTFFELPRKYDVKFYSYDGSLLLSDALTFGSNIKAELEKDTKYVRTEDIERETSKSYYIWSSRDNQYNLYTEDDFAHNALFEIVDREAAPIPFFIYREDNSIAEDERWALEGWVTLSDFNNNTLVNGFYNMDTETIKGVFNAYARMKIENVRTTPSNMEIFEFSNDNSGNRQIALKSQYADVIQGKVTLPLQDKDGKNIVKVANKGFHGLKNITHIYFQEGNSKYTTIGSYAFAAITADANNGLLKLNTVELPEGIITIMSNAFESQIVLENINLPSTLVTIESAAFSSNVGVSNNMSYYINELPDSITTIGSGAFSKGGSNFVLTKLPPNLKIVNTNTFQFCDKVAIREFGTDTSGVGLTTINANAFANSGKQAVLDFDRVIINKSIETISYSKEASLLGDPPGINAFNNSYFEKIAYLDVYSSEFYDIYEQWGFADAEIVPVVNYITT